MHASQTETVVGRVVGLWRYPVKSMAAEPLSDANVGWFGLAGDRRWAFIRDGVEQSGFPWLTLRDRANLNHYQPSFVDPSRPDQSPTVVRTPSGATFDVADSALATELGDGARVIRQDRGIFDTFPLSIITTQTVEQLGEMLGTQLDMRRFRPNILVEASSREPFPEDRWVGSIVRIGESRMRIDKRDGRCVVITIDPDSGERDPDILRAVAQERDGCLGVYGTTVEPGRIAMEDPVLIESPA